LLTHTFDFSYQKNSQAPAFFTHILNTSNVCFLSSKNIL
jgi:hypothetical protein